VLSGIRFCRQSMKINLGVYMKKIILLGIILLSVSSLWAQNWEKTNNKNKWGEIEDYSYNQTIRFATAHYNGRNSTVVVIFIYYPRQNVFAIGSKTISSLDIHPAANFIDDSFTLTLRGNDGKETTYPGLIPATPDFTSVIMGLMDDRLIKLLKTNGEWDVLIEGKRWYIRTTIKGGLPEK